MNSKRKALPALALAVSSHLLAVCSSLLAAEQPEVCSNSELLKAISIIEQACTREYCSFDLLRQLDSHVEKSVFLGALANPHLHSVHLFFPRNEASIEKVFDWNATKRDQLASLLLMDNPADSVIFVLGQASATGDAQHNRDLSYERMQSILRYLSDELVLSCGGYRVAWLGEEVMQLHLSDANFLHIAPQDYRGDEYILNQSVHVFVFPCARLLRK